MVVVRGVNLYPSAVEQVLRNDGAIAEFQVEISTAADLPELRLRIEPNAPDINQAELSDRIGQSLHRAFGLRFNVECAAPGALPRFEMKAKRWTRS
jgi:phenylacetate-CoA ligase